VQKITPGSACRVAANGETFLLASKASGSRIIDAIRNAFWHGLHDLGYLKVRQVAWLNSVTNSTQAEPSRFQ
jgi:hypothetical protein